MEFLVTLGLDRGRVPAEQLDGLLAEERAVARGLRAAGAIARIWSVPERGQSVSVWSAPDQAAVESLIDTLPLRPWLAVEVLPLSTHYLEAEDASS